jgi:ABC-type glycerol-3-phosphate transport system substrate-binding protein
VKDVRRSDFLALGIALVVGACSASATGNEAFVTVTYANTPAAGLPAATEWCAKYSKIPPA